MLDANDREEKCNGAGARRTDRFFRVEVDGHDGALVARQLREEVCGVRYRRRRRDERRRTLYRILPLSTSHIQTVRSALPTATRAPPSSLLHAHLNNAFSYPAICPTNALCTLSGFGLNGLTSYTSVCPPRLGASKNWPFGLNASEHMVSFCPVNAKTSACLRRS